MADGTRYRVSPDLILREEDRSLFSLSRLQVYEFNADGFTILMHFKEPASVEEVFAAVAGGFAGNEAAFFSFVAKAVSNDILVPQDA